MSRGRLLLVGLLSLIAGSCARQEEIPDLYPVPDFHLTERSGRAVGRDDLAGHVWIADFIFTNCTVTCPQVTLTMQGLQNDLKDHPAIRLVTFTVDPERDDPARLTVYADKFNADPARWLFLTGKQAEIHRLLADGFKLAVPQNEGTARKQGEEVVHSTRLVLVDKKGRIRGYFEGIQQKAGENPEAELKANLKKLREQAIRLQNEP